MNLGRGRNRALAITFAAAVLVLGVVACGEEKETHVVEGEPIELGDLRFNVQLTRFLNPTDTEDAEYLEGLPAPPPTHDYLAVFMDVENEGDDELRLPSATELEVTDTTDRKYEPVEAESLFALDLGAPIEAGGEAPEVDSAASSGPVQGAFVLFLVDVDVSENRPLELEIKADGAEGTIELDI
jgi:hypothetical protein